MKRERERERERGVRKEKKEERWGLNFRRTFVVLRLTMLINKEELNDGNEPNERMKERNNKLAKKKKKKERERKMSKLLKKEGNK